MISRCPSCAAEVDEAASRCPSCHWDFELRKRVVPDAEAKSEEPSKAVVPRSGTTQPSPEPPLPTSAGRRIDVDKSDKKAKAAPEPEPPPPPGAGLKQFSRVNPAEVPNPEEPAEKKQGFSVPVARPVQKEYQGPPKTEMRIAPGHKAEKASGSAEKDRRDAAERFKKKGKPETKEKTTPKSGQGFAFDPKLAAGIVASLIISIVVVYLILRPPSAPSPRVDGLLGKVGSVVGDAQPDRDIKKVQRVLVEQAHPEIEPPKAPVAPPPPQSPAPIPPPNLGPVPPPPAPAATWDFQGQAYDLITLKPVRGAQLSFRALGGEQVSQTATDEHGRFKLAVSALAEGGYELTVKHPDYLDGYIDEMSPPLKEADRDERRTLAASAARNERWMGKTKSGMSRDIILIPKVVPADLQ